MGVSNSKTILETIEPSEADINNLIFRLQEDEGPFDSVIRDCLLRTFSIYETKIKNTKNRRRESKGETTKISELIVKATNELKKFPSNNNQPETFHFIEMGIPEIKRRLYHIAETINKNANVRIGNGYLLKEVSSYYHILSNSGRLLSPQEKDGLSVLILKLYLNSPRRNFSTILDRSLSDLNRIMKDLGTLNSQSLKTSKQKEIKKKLKQTRSTVDELSKVIDEALLEVDNWDPTQLFSSGTEDEVCKVKRSHSIASSGDIERNKNKRQQNLSVPGPGRRGTYKHQNKKDKKKETSKKNVDGIEKRIEAIVESAMGFEDKTRSLEDMKKEVDDNDVINRLSGYIILESRNQLRQLNKNIEIYKNSVEDFPFSSDSDFFKRKYEDIHLLKKRISDLSKTNPYIKSKKISDDIDKVLGALEAKAKHNKDVISHMKKLEEYENLVRDIGTKETCGLKELNDLNEIRGKISSINNFHKRIDAKKAKICSKIQEIEKKIYENRFPKLVKETKLALDEVEGRALTFTDVYGSDTYETMKNEISDLRSKVENDDSTIPNYKKTFGDTTEIVSQILEKTAQANSERNRLEEQLKSIEKNVITSNTLKEDFFENQKELDSIEVDHNFGEILDLKRNIQSRINIQTAKPRFNEFVKKREELKNKIKMSERPFNVELFEKVLNGLFSIKDLVDDMPVGDEGLDSCTKQIFNNEMYNILASLDEQLASTAMKQQQSENIVDLGRRFNKFEMDDLNVGKNSVEFVEMIRSKAGSLEEYAKYYMGSTVSVDYYVIHESLMRLLEELDFVNCDGDELLLEKTVEAISYIKNLLSMLSSHVSS